MLIIIELQKQKKPKFSVKKELAKKADNTAEVLEILREFKRVIRVRFPKLVKMFSEAKDCRGSQGCQYLFVEHLFGGLSMFLFKEGSRNQFNNQRKANNFLENYKQIFEMSLPHQDTIAEVIKQLDPKELEEIKMKLVGEFFEQKWLRSERLFNKYYYVAVDATGIQSFKERHCEHCLTKTTKNTTTYFHYVLEAKLVTHSGFALPLASEWI